MLLLSFQLHPSGRGAHERGALPSLGWRWTQAPPSFLGWPSGWAPACLLPGDTEGDPGVGVRGFCDTFVSKAQCSLQPQIPTCAGSVLPMPLESQRCPGLSLALLIWGRTPLTACARWSGSSTECGTFGGEGPQSRLGSRSASKGPLSKGLGVSGRPL